MEWERNQPRERAGSTPLPDPMTQAYATDTDTKGKGVDEPDTCRICRGEATEEEQLFYPCKCSGSIKFVHQACLMEWLSHSQKKYCELCKTPFRFTKLYDPNMPQELPAPVFLKELAIHGFRTLVTWLRFVLVAFVWLGWLPWSMRAIWRALFWLADGRWPTSGGSQQQAMETAEKRLAELAANGTTPIENPLASGYPASATAQSAAGALPQVLSPVSSMLNFTAGEPMILSLAKKAFLSLFVPAISSSTNSSQVNTTTLHRQRQPSWLSDVAFLNSLTSSPTFNNILIDTLEGQLITLLVVISFILVFLIREWVVQQQPAVNIGEAEREEAAQLIAENRPNQDAQAPPREPEGVLRPADEPPAGGRQGNEQETNASNREEGSRAGTPFQPGPQVHVIRGQLLPGQLLQGQLLQGQVLQGQVLQGQLLQARFPPSEPSSSRPSLQSGNAPGEASSSHPLIQEIGNPVLPGLETFKDLWIRGEGNPDEILRIIEEEGRQEELGWVVSAMTKLKRAEAVLYSQEPGTRSPNDSSNSGESTNVNDMPGPARPRAIIINASSFLDGRQGGAQLPSMSGAPVAGGSTSDANDVPASRDSPSSRDLGGEGSGSHDHIVSSDSSDSEGDEGIENQQGPREETYRPVSGTPSGEAPARPAETQEGSSTTYNTANADEQSSDTARQPSSSDPAPAALPPQNLVDRILDWLWGDVAPSNRGQRDVARDEQRIVEDPALEAPFVPVQNRQRDAQDLDAVAGAADAADAGPEANDVDAVEEGDDLEGIMELIGMQGPIFGLLQNGVFSALLIAFTIAVGIWLPYLWGKIALVFLTNPVQLFIGVPLALLSIIADVAVDTLIGSLGYVLYGVSLVLKVLRGPMGKFLPPMEWISRNISVRNASLYLISSSSQRLKKVVHGFFTFHESDLPVFSVLAHQALRVHEARIASLFKMLCAVGKFVLHDLPLGITTKGVRGTLSLDRTAAHLKGLFTRLPGLLQSIGNSTFSFLASLSSGNLLKVKGISAAQVPLDYELARWDTKDRIIAIIIGYIFATMLGVLYLRLIGLFSGVNRGQRIEGVVADVLHQAGGVMKVILIIGIEMIIFPLYCGVLLDLALMPLFENATLESRINFTVTSPLTSLFVHWFIGTCYMFHFALFVSMCRKIMRSGVLCKSLSISQNLNSLLTRRELDFIRDPDDPTFHPVRDVLERNVTTQLRKIAFSALVYGALVVICLGGVVWGLSFAFDGVFPIYWSSSVPVLEFPVDLLFYNFVMPFAIQSVKPSDGLHNMYNWWFRKCARMLRLTNFLFGERRRDEEGRHVRRTWRDVLSGKKGDPEHPVIGEEQRAAAEKQGLDAYFLRDGKFVRTPASDQVRIPKGGRVFLEVTEDNKRVDGAPDPDDGLHGRNNNMFTKVYIPPFFKLRIALFILLIWIFAAITGVSITVVPLVVGRRMIASLFPSHVRVNDIYAFSAGLYSVGGAVYALLYCRTGLSLLKERYWPSFKSPRQAVRGAYDMALNAMRLIYVSSAFSLLLPSLFALLTELYVLVPLHTYLEGGQAHVIHLVQDWTLGVLYVQMALKFILWNSTSRAARALNAIIRDGWLKPNVRLATRGFILPASVLALVAVVVPLFLGFLTNLTVFYGATSDVHAKVYRYAYPATLSAGLLVWLFHLLRRQIEIWRVNIRDEVYLIGERLHNFGEKRARDVGVPRRMIT